MFVAASGANGVGEALNNLHDSLSYTQQRQLREQIVTE